MKNRTTITKQQDSKDNCQICGNSFSYELISKNRNHNGIEYKSKWVECVNCGSAHIDPYPTEVELLSYYSSGYVEQIYEYGSAADQNHKFHYSKSNEKIVFENYGYSLKDANITQFELKEMTILDYGCANGIFYTYLKNICGVSKNNIYGVDVESDMLEECRKISPNFYSTREIHKIEKQFDLITMWNVIEHIYNPKDAIKSMIRLLKEDGLIFLETPMYGSLGKKLGEDWSHYIAIEHINLFSRSAIKQIFEDCGMKCISESSFGANLFGSIKPNVKKALDQMAKEYDFGATQVLCFKKI